MVGLLGDTPQRDYSRKLQLFNNFAASELRQAMGGLALKPGMSILDAGCGRYMKFCKDLSDAAAVVGIDSRSHEGYLSWKQFEEIQQMMTNNAHLGDRSAPRGED